LRLNRLTRRIATLGVAALVGIATAAVTAPQAASAHGVAMVPGARTWLCYQDGLDSTGAINPTNPACKAAVAAGGAQPLYDWFGVLRSDAAGRTSGYINDGEICGAGTTKYAAYNAARDDWPLTHLTSGATIQMRYSNWARHPGTFRLYVTRDGWSPTTPLAWSDLVSIGSVTDPPESGPAGSLNYYYWNQQLPTKSGRHILYIQWVRSDSQENFFSCSDVIFDGGHGEVTGVRGSGTTSPTTGATTTRPPTSTPPVTTSPTGGNTGGACTASWALQPSTWDGHFQVNVTVKNTSSSSINGWTVKWAFSGGQGFDGSPWNATVVSQPPDVTLSNVDWNKTVAAGATTSFGFNATGTAPSTAPALTCSSP
jgi:predicted carbohydrate-binding protein with CBM5 and CBM33 domain